MRDQAACSPDFDGEEVDAGDDIGVRFQEGGPRGWAFWRRLDAVFLQGLCDCRWCDAVVEISQLALYSALAPARIGGVHADFQIADRLHDPGAADAVGRVGPLRGDQLPVPAHDGVGRHDGCDATE